MQREIRYILGMFTFLCAASHGLAQVSVTSALDNNKILIGDQAVLHLEAKYPANVKLLGVDLSSLDSVFTQTDSNNPDPDPGQLEILKIAKWDTLIQNGVALLKGDVILTCWKTGIYYIPPVIFHFQIDNNTNQTRATNQLELLVDSPLGDDAAAADSVQLAPIKDIIVEPLKLQDFLPYIIGLLVLPGLVFLGVFLYRKYKKKKELAKITVIKKAPHEIAFEQLKQLKEAKLWQQGMFKEYQSQLSHIIREYVEKRYEILALESTTDEILRGLKQKDFNEDLKDNLKEMLQLADLVKFAKAEPPVERHEQLMRFAEDFVNQTKKLPQAENAESLEHLAE